MAELRALGQPIAPPSQAVISVAGAPSPAKLLLELVGSVRTLAKDRELLAGKRIYSLWSIPKFLMLINSTGYCC